MFFGFDLTSKSYESDSSDESNPDQNLNKENHVKSPVEFSLEQKMAALEYFKLNKDRKMTIYDGYDEIYKNLKIDENCEMTRQSYVNLIAGI